MTPQQPGYPPQYQAVYAVRPSMLPHSVWAFVLSIVAFITPLLFFVSLPLAVTSVILGHLSLSKIAKSPIPRGGRGFAITALILGYIAIVVAAWVLLFALALRDAMGNPVYGS